MSKNTGTSELINYFDLGANGDVGIAGSLDINTIANATTDTDTFLVSDTGIIKYRTGAQLLSDIGGQGLLTNPVTGTGTTNYLPKFTGSTTIGNSNVQDTGSAVIVDSHLNVNGGDIRFDDERFVYSYAGGSIGQYRSGIYFDGSGLTQRFFINNAESMRLSSSANLLVGTTTDNGAKLQVSGVSASSALSLRNTTGGTLADFIITENTGLIVNSYEGATARSIDFRVANSSALFVATNANIGIGTPTPSGKLHLSSTSDTYLVMTGGASPRTYSFLVDATNLRLFSGVGDTTLLTIASTGAATFSSSVTANGISSIGQEQAFTWQRTTGTASDVYSLNADSGSAYLYNNTTARVLMTWLEGGNVLIGTTTDNGARLQVSGNATATRLLLGTSTASSYRISIVANSNFDTSGILMQDTNTGGRVYTIGSSITTVGNLEFFDATAGTLRFSINSSGDARFTSLGTGTVFSNGGTLTNTNPSDFNLKENIAPINYGLGEILQLNPVTFNWKNDTINQGKQYGFIAQEVQKIMPDLVKKGEYLGLDKEAIFTTLVKAIQELKQEIDTLKN